MEENKPEIPFKMDYYTNMSDENFNIFCERLVTLHKTGVYIPPPKNPVICNNKKNNTKVRKSRKYVEDIKKRSTFFGKGKIGVSHELYGVEKCSCCNVTNNFLLYNSLNLQNSLPNIEEGILQENNIPFGQGKHGIAHELYGVEKCSCCNVTNSFLLYNSHNSQYNRTNIQKDAVQENKNIGHNYCLNNNNTVIMVDHNKSNEEDIITISDLNDNSLHIQTNNQNSNQYNIAEIITISDNETDDINFTPKKSFKNIQKPIFILDDDMKENTIIPKFKTQKTEFIDLKIRSTTLLESLRNTINNESNIQNNSNFVNRNKSAIIGNNIKSQSPEKNLDPFYCIICLESLENKELMSTICGHMFCSVCVISYIKTNKCCPKCKKRLTLKSIHPIYF